jgi:hypothetical protein
MAASDPKRRELFTSCPELHEPLVETDIALAQPISLL